MKDTPLKCNPGDHLAGDKKNIAGDEDSLERAARLFRALGDVPRLQLLQMLAHREWCVTEIVAALEENFSTISQRLRILRTDGLVSRRREGTHIFYALADDHVLELLNNALAHAEELKSSPSQTSQPKKSLSPKKKGKS